MKKCYYAEKSVICLVSAMSNVCVRSGNVSKQSNRNTFNIKLQGIFYVFCYLYFLLLYMLYYIIYIVLLCIFMYS